MRVAETSSELRLCPVRLARSGMSIREGRNSIGTMDIVEEVDGGARVFLR